MFAFSAPAFASCITGYESTDMYKIVQGTDCGAGYEATDKYKLVDGTDCGAGYERTDDFLPDAAGGLSDAKGSYSYVCIP
jgi:hypothetical protein